MTRRTGDRDRWPVDDRHGQAPLAGLHLPGRGGPGVIAANAGNDAGGVATYASAGAQFGYSMLFFMVVITVGYVCIQEMVARLAAHTGKGLAALIREQFSLRLSAFAVFAFAVANLGLVVTEFAGIGSAFELWGCRGTSRCRSPRWPSGCSSSSVPTATPNGCSCC